MSDEFMPDEGGKLISIVSYDADGKVDSKQFNSYGKDGLLLEKNILLEGRFLEKRFSNTIRSEIFPRLLFMRLTAQRRSHLSAPVSARIE